MNSKDEIRSLIIAQIDGSIDEAESVKLNNLLRTDVEVRREFMEHAAFEAILRPATDPLIGQSTTLSKDLAQKTVLEKSISRLYKPWAEEALEMEAEYKKQLAETVVSYKAFSLYYGAGVFIDAGSSCLTVWWSISREMSEGKYKALKVLTSNFDVALDWLQNQAAPHLLGTDLQIAGSGLLGPQKAFYGEEARRKLLESGFRAHVVYIGISGIEFTESGILLGYAAGDEERKVKELLFQCPAKNRVMLATPTKFGQAGAGVINLNELAKEGGVSSAQIYLATPEPKPETTEFREYRAMRGRFSQLQSDLLTSGVNMTWLISTNDPENPLECLAPEIGNGESEKEASDNIRRKTA